MLQSEETSPSYPPAQEDRSDALLPGAVLHLRKALRVPEASKVLGKSPPVLAVLQWDSLGDVGTSQASRASP